MTIYSELKKLLRGRTEKYLDDSLNWASGPSGFLRLVLSIRFVILLFITAYFGYTFTDLSSPILKAFVDLVIWFYFLGILYLLSLSILWPDQFESHVTQKWQVVLDVTFASCLYWVSVHVNRQPGLGMFLLYFLPLLVAARFLSLRTTLFLMTCIFLVSITIWTLELKNNQNYSTQLRFMDLLPQFGFLLIMTIFYMIYYRRRRMGEGLQTAALILEDQIGELWQGWFSVDGNLNVVAIDSAMKERHGIIRDGMSCAQILCLKELPISNFCDNCPLSKALTSVGNQIVNANMKLTDRNGATYNAQIKASPVINHFHKIAGVNVWLQDLDERDSLLQKQRMFTDDLERVIDQNRQEDHARAENLARKFEAISQASASALAVDTFRGADEIVRAMVLMLGCQLATVRQHQIDEVTGREGLVLCNHYGVKTHDIERISFLDLKSSSLVVKAFNTGQDQYVEDFQKPDLAHEDVFRSYGVRSIACFPLKMQGKSIGTFTLFRNRRQGFSEGDLQLGRALSNIMVNLVANQRQLVQNQEEAQRRKNELDMLSSLSLKLATMDDPKKLAQLVADIVLGQLRAETVAVFLKDGDILYRSAISGLDTDWFKEERYSIGQGLTGIAALATSDYQFGQPVVENDVEQSNLVIQENLKTYRQQLLSGTVQHLLAIPLNGFDGTFGVLRAVNKMDSFYRLDKRGFSEQDAAFMTTIACIVAVALENARSFETEKKKHLLEQALRLSTRNLSSTLEEGEILAIILEQLKKVVEYDTASLFLWENDGLRLKSLSGFSYAEAENLQKVCLDPNINPPFKRMRENHKPILINDLWKEPLLEPILGTSRIRSWIGAPLIIKSQIIGWLSVDSWSPDKFTQEDVEIAQDFAQQAAIAINNARQYMLQKEQSAFLMMLDDRLVEINSTTDKNITMNKIAVAASQLMNCDYAGVALYDKEKKEIRAIPGVGCVGVPDEYIRNFSFSLDHPGGKVIRDRKVYHSKDTSKDSDSIFGHRLTEPIGAKGVIAAPLMVGDYILGILYAASRSPREWTDFQLTFFSILSNHAAIAIRNSELFDIKERRAQLLNLLHHLSIAGQLTDNPEIIYNILLTAVTAEYGLRFNRAMIMLYDKESNLLKGFTGIGQLENSDAYQVWGSLDANSHSFESYIDDVLSKGVLHYTTLHYKAKNLKIPIRVGTNEVFSRVFLTRKMEVVNPANEQEKINEDLYKIFDANPFVIMPLLVNNEVVGMLVADKKMSGDSIRKVELDLLESCSSQVAAAIYRSNLHRQLEDRIQVLEHLQVLTRAFSELAEPREVLRQIAEATVDILDADIAYLVPYDHEKDELMVKDAVTAGAETGFRHMETFSAHGLTALAKQEPAGLVVIDDLKSKKELHSRFAEQENVHSVAVCRLELRKKIVGMLYVNYRRHHWFSDIELNTLQMLAGQAAVAINNARLLKQNESLATQRERNRLREDLHDTLNTYAFKVMEPVESILEKEKVKRRPDSELVDEAEELWRFSRHIYQQLERILVDMRDPVLVEHGLPVAVRLLVEHSKLPGVNLSIRGQVRPSADVELVLYRICQEAISNIHKHAKLPKQGNGLCNIILELEPERSRLFIQDFGVGFSPEIKEDRKRRMGMQAMEDWARKVGANIIVDSSQGQGTTVEVEIQVMNKEMQV